MLLPASSGRGYAAPIWRGQAARSGGGSSILTMSSTTQVFVCVKPVDMRRSFDGLFALARDFLGQDPMSGHLFAFRNRRGDRLKILWWDREGLAIFYKRLEEGSFRFPSPSDPSDVGAASECTNRIEMSSADLQLVLQGIDLASAKRSKRYRRPTPTLSTTPTANASPT